MRESQRPPTHPVASVANRESIADGVLELVARRGMVRARDVARAGISPTHLQRLHEQGRLARSGRGVYTLPEASLDENQSLSEIALRVPGGVVCLLSALQFHGIGTQSPHQVWLALPPRAHRPVIDWPPLRVVQFSPELMEAGVDEHLLNGVPVRVTNPARTIVDCFRFRNKIGIDIAIEAVRDGWRDGRFRMDEIERYQKLAGVARVMRPYLEAIVS